MTGSKLDAIVLGSVLHAGKRIATRVILVKSPGPSYDLWARRHHEESAMTAQISWVRSRLPRSNQEGGGTHCRIPRARQCASNPDRAHNVGAAPPDRQLSKKSGGNREGKNLWPARARIVLLSDVPLRPL